MLVIVEQPSIVGKLRRCFNSAQYDRITLVRHIHNGKLPRVNMCRIERVIVGIAIVNVTKLIKFTYIRRIVRICVQIKHLCPSLK